MRQAVTLEQASKHTIDDYLNIRATHPAVVVVVDALVTFILLPPLVITIVVNLIVLVVVLSAVVFTWILIFVVLVNSIMSLRNAASSPLLQQLLWVC